MLGIIIKFNWTLNLQNIFIDEKINRKEIKSRKTVKNLNKIINKVNIIRGLYHKMKCSILDNYSFQNQKIYSSISENHKNRIRDAINKAKILNNFQNDLNKTFYLPITMLNMAIILWTCYTLFALFAFTKNIHSLLNYVLFGLISMLICCESATNVIEQV